AHAEPPDTRTAADREPGALPSHAPVGSVHHIARSASPCSLASGTATACAHYPVATPAAPVDSPSSIPAPEASCDPTYPSPSPVIEDLSIGARATRSPEISDEPKKSRRAAPAFLRPRPGGGPARSGQVAADQLGHLEHRDLGLLEDFLQLGVGVDVAFV